MKHFERNIFHEIIRITAAALLFNFFGATFAMSEAPVGKMSYQGTLSNAVGNPLTGSYDLSFKICDSLAGACAAAPNLLWNESQLSVSVDRGHISVDLGAANPIPLNIFNGATTYLEITVNPDSAMSPRIRLLPAPYSFNAYSLQGYVFDAFVATYSVQAIEGNKTFFDNVSISSLAIIGTITSTSSIAAGDAVLRTVRAASATVAGTVTSTSGFTGGMGNFGTVSASSLSVTGTLTSTSVITGGGFVGVGSTLTLLNASNLALGTVPNARIDSSSVAKWNASGRIDNFRLDPSSVTLFGPIRSRSMIGIWARVNLANSLSDSQLTLVPIDAATNATAANSSMPMPFNGIVRGIIVSGSGARTSGTATFKVFKNGSLVGSGPDAVIDGTNTQYVASSGGTETFSAGDLLDIRVTTSGWAPTNQEWFAQIIVEWTS